MQCKVLDPPYVDFLASLIHVHDPIVDPAAMKIILSCKGSLPTKVERSFLSFVDKVDHFERGRY